METASGEPNPRRRRAARVERQVREAAPIDYEVSPNGRGRLSSRPTPPPRISPIDREVERSVHAQMTRLPSAKVVAYLREVLGDRLTAVVAGSRDGRAIYDWTKGDRQPLPDTDERLRLAYRIVQLLIRTESPDTVRVWFRGRNPELDDESPALMMSTDPLRVLQAARTFLVN